MWLFNPDHQQLRQPLRLGFVVLGQKIYVVA